MSETPLEYRPRVLHQELVLERLRKVKLVAFDVDGTLTDGRIGFVGSERALFFHTHDGHGIHDLIQAGFLVAWATTNKTPAVRDRACSLGVHYLIQGRHNKKAAIEELGIPWEAIAFLGDDMNDVPCMLAAGVAFAVANAQRPAQMAAHRLTQLPGGQGAAREVADLILRANGFEVYVTPSRCEWRKRNE